PMGNISVVSELAVPLRQGKQTIGVLTVVSPHKDYFTDDDVDQMTTLATLAAITINRAKLTGHVKELSQKVVQGVGVDDLLQYIVLAVRDLTFNNVNLWMISSRADEGNHYLRIADHSPEIDPLFVRDARLSTDPEKSICGLALNSGQTQIRGDILHDDKQPAFQYTDIAHKQGWRAFMAIPMIGGDGEQIGVITV
ncbi:MAG: GAF domain-containing protein, partial [Planctomycetes bacterium]|nr:GAF domain-containing protein [Planctomycetota bacterium]